jgi:hypothetical protein
MLRVRAFLSATDLSSTVLNIFSRMSRSFGSHRISRKTWPMACKQPFRKPYFGILDRKLSIKQSQQDVEHFRTIFGALSAKSAMNLAYPFKSSGARFSTDVFAVSSINFRDSSSWPNYWARTASTSAWLSASAAVANPASRKALRLTWSTSGACGFPRY